MSGITNWWSRIRFITIGLLLALLLTVVWLRAGVTRGMRERLFAQKSRTTLRVWDWWAPTLNESYARYFETVEREFESVHPDVDLVFQYVPFGQYEQKMATALVGKNPPDVFQSSVYWAEGFYDRGMLLPLNRFLERERRERKQRKSAGLPIDAGQIVDKEAFLESAWRHNTKPDGTVFGIPQILDASCLIWNLDILQKAAQTDAEIRAMFERNADGSVNWNRLKFEAVHDWKHFRRIVRKLTVYDASGKPAVNEKGDEVQAGFVIHAHGSGAGPFMPWLSANGGNFQDTMGTRALFADERGVGALQFLLDLYWKDRVSPAFRRQLTDSETFEQRRSACMVAGTWSGKYIVRNTEGWKHFDKTAFPPGPRGHGQTTLTWGNMLVIPRRCRNPELAWTYVKFITCLEGSRRLLRTIEQNSPRRDFYMSPDWEEAVRQNPHLHNVPAICASGKKLRHTQINAVDHALQPIFETVLLHAPEIEAGHGPYPSVRAGLEAAADAVNRVYDRYNKQVAYWRQLHQ